MLQTWASLYANSAAIRTVIGFAHIAGLVVGGGCAIVADRATLAAARRATPGQWARMPPLRGVHRIVLAGLGIVLASGFLMAAADADTYLHSRVFWVKMVLVALLGVNGALIYRIDHGLAATAARPRVAAAAAVASLVLWLLITFAGAALPNV